MEKSADKRRFFIVGAGRSGSSLLAAVLADAGAEFGMPHRDSWDTKGGAYEHQTAIRAYMWYQRARKIEASVIPDRLQHYCDRRAVSLLSPFLETVRYVKTSNLIWLTQPANRLGYAPVIIISYRSFAGYARSRYVRFGWSLPRLIENYYESYSSALLQLDIFGGCTIDFEELVNPAETSWADALAQLTGCSRDKMIESRNKRLTGENKPSTPLLFDQTPVDGRTTAVYTALTSLKGQVIAPSRSRK